jgi:hypothetical protein
MRLVRLAVAVRFHGPRSAIISCGGLGTTKTLKFSLSHMASFTATSGTSTLPAIGCARSEPVKKPGGHEAQGRHGGKG